MIIAIDAGNTRIKWGVHDGQSWVGRGALLTAEAAEFSAVLDDWPEKAVVVACNVAGAGVEAAIVGALESRFDVHWLRPAAAACGVRNSYEQPERLGADRWAALIGARALEWSGAGSGERLVVCAGTATTVDRLDTEGVFRGGIILPGFDLMRESLARNTAQLPLADGHFRAEPRNTADAIASGCLQAQIGAVERMYSTLAGGPGAECVLTGGAAHRLLPHLGIPCRHVEHLVLDGLVRFATSQ